MYFNIQYSYTHSKLSHQKEWPFRVLFLALPVVGANNSSGTPELKMILFLCPPEDLLRGGEPQNSKGGCAPNVSLHQHLISHQHDGESVSQSLGQLVILGNLPFLAPVPRIHGWLICGPSRICKLFPSITTDSTSVLFQLVICLLVFETSI